MLDRLTDKYQIVTEVVTETTRHHLVRLSSEDFCAIFNLDEDPSELRWTIYHDSGSYHKNEDEEFFMTAYKGEEKIFNYHESQYIGSFGKLKIFATIRKYVTDMGYDILDKELHLQYSQYDHPEGWISAGWSEPTVYERKKF